MALALLMLLSLLFAATHLGMSHEPWRTRIIERLGQQGFLIAYSVVAIVTLGGSIWVFATHKHMGPHLWTMPGWLLPVVYLLVLLSFLMIVQAVATPSPTGMRPALMEARGVLRITRHPMNMGVACFGLAHIMANGALGDVFFFGSLFVVGFVGAYHQDRRKTRELGLPFELFRSQTGVLPFAAILRGKTRLETVELSRPLMILAIVTFASAMALHKKLFGASPF